jgi:DNA-binding CsgD family transcriptional regulator
MESRIAALSPAARHVAMIASAHPGAIAVGRLTATLGRTVADLLPALQELDEAGVLRAEGDLLAFRHESIRRATAASIPAPVLTELRRELREAGDFPDTPPVAPRPQRGPSAADGPRQLHLVVSAPAPQGNRELDVTRLAVQGLTNREIARRLHVSPHTVNYYLRRIYRRLNINSRVQLAAYATAHVS